MENHKGAAMTLSGLIRDFLRDRRGNVAMTFGLLMPMVIGLAGIAIDKAVWESQRQRLQNASDAASLAAAAVFNDSRYTTTSARVEAATAAAKAVIAATEPNLVPTIAVDSAAKGVSVSLADKGIIGFAGLLGITNVDLGAASGAKADSSKGKICILALDPGGNPGILFSGDATFTAKGCAVWSNSGTKRSVVFQGSSVSDFDLLCSAGEVVVNGAKTVSVPGQYCQPLADPLSSYTPSVPTTCDKTNFKVSSNTDVTLAPGLYCGGIDVTSKANVTLQPGRYFIKNGDLKITATGNVTGEGVAMHLVGKATADVSGQKVVRLTAMNYGDMAGKVLSGDRGQTGNLVSKITGGSALDLMGTIYLPSNQLVFTGNAAVTVSPLNQLIANTIQVNGTTKVTFFADFVTAKLPEIVAYLPSVRLLK
ncbi:TadE/TadG family type IV pilus assembly protein [Prosthecomicrobium sp. N25]|uniref:TadE/TadG family type IV pilus assembly protein n=1 Tax=Prosthecomicrobium sp. N25 TaxID=3129254 RepID=UPI003078A3A9